MANYCVLGQSNSILKHGFISHLQQFSQHSMTNVGRIGSSASTLIPYFCNDKFFTGNQFCLIDMCVVDAAMISAGAYDIGHHIKYLDYAGHLARMNGCQPVYVIIPLQYHYNAPRLTDLFYSAVESVVRKGGYFYLDWREAMNDLKKTDENNYDRFYGDPNHPSSEFQELMARSIAAAFDKEHKYSKERFQGYLPNFRTISLADVFSSDLEVVEYKTSLFHFRGVRLTQGKQMVVSSGYKPGNAHLIGMMVNAAKCSAKISISGARNIVKDMNCKAYSSGNYEVRLAPIYSDIAENERGTITIEIADRNAAAHEGVFPPRTEALAEDQIEIGELIFELTGNEIFYEALVPSENNFWKIS